MTVNNHICLHCGACVGACPTNSIFLFETSAIEFQPTCTECGLCVMICPVGAIAWTPKSSAPPPHAIVPEIRP